MIGGDGSDRFRFDQGDASYAMPGYLSDTIADFSDGQDKIFLAGGIGSRQTDVLHAQPGIVLTSMAAAFTYAQQLLDASPGVRDVAALAVGGDSYLFYNDSGGGTVNSIVKLAGVGNALSIGSSDFLAAI